MCSENSYLAKRIKNFLFFSNKDIYIKIAAHTNGTRLAKYAVSFFFFFFLFLKKSIQDETSSGHAAAVTFLFHHLLMSEQLLYRQTGE